MGNGFEYVVCGVCGSLPNDVMHGIALGALDLHHRNAWWHLLFAWPHSIGDNQDAATGTGQRQSTVPTAKLIERVVLMGLGLKVLVIQVNRDVASPQLYLQSRSLLG